LFSIPSVAGSEMSSLGLLESRYLACAITSIAVRLFGGKIYRKHLSLPPDPDWIRIRSGFNHFSGSGSRSAKMAHKNRKKLRSFMF
jgi:hypothetical protein